MKQVHRVCPLCGTENLIVVKAMTQEEARKRLKSNAYSHSIEATVLSMMADNENDFVEENFKDEEKWGCLYICKDCGMDFREFENFPYKHYKTRISKEEFVSEYRKAVDRQLSSEIPDKGIRENLVDMVVQRVCEEERKYFYKEFLDDILTEMELQANYKKPD